MPRLVVLGGFLGSGKTTALLRVARELNASGKTVAIVTNDQGSELVDSALFRAAGHDTEEVRGGCFCCRLDDFVAQARELVLRSRPDVILAEPVGSCTDLVATVLRPVQQLHAGTFELAPYVVLVDPFRARDALSPRGSATLSEKVTYIYRLQQMEAETIAVSKADLLSAEELQEVRLLLREKFPGKRVLSFSAESGAGFSDLVAYLLDSRAANLPRSPEIDYDVYAEGEAELAWFDGSFRVSSPAAIEVDRAVADLAARLQIALREASLDIAHVKLLSRAGAVLCAASVTRSGVGVAVSGQSRMKASAFELIVNARVAAPGATLAKIAERCIGAWAEALDAVAIARSVTWFSPQRPVPTTRIA